MYRPLRTLLVSLLICLPNVLLVQVQAASADAREKLIGTYSFVGFEIKDANDKVVKLTSNASGNFYSAESLEPPLETAVVKDGHRLVASQEQPNGACNTCHNIPPTDQADGRLYWSTN